MSKEDQRLVHALRTHLDPRQTREQIDQANLDSFDIYKVINRSI